MALSLMVVLSHSLAYAQNDTTAAGILNQLKDFNADRVAEKVYLHFDKPYYALGDTIYFKAYVTMGERHEPGRISGVLHADLINGKNKIQQSLKLKLHAGTAWGDFVLSDTLPVGNYRVRAYTRWMLNNGADNFFDQTLRVGSAINNKVFESALRGNSIVNQKANIQFFPEGGELLEGIDNKVAFKISSNNGAGLDATGVLTDNAGRQITTFKSSHLGMGYFIFKPESGKNYQARITLTDGSSETAALPSVMVKGIVLKIKSDSLMQAHLQIVANNKCYLENKGGFYNLLVYSAGFATVITCKLDSAMIDLAIVKRHLHTGITRITLFSAAGEPLSERLLFVQNADHLNLDVGTDRPVYRTRGQVKINIHATNPVDSAISGHFSIAITDERKVTGDNENSIASYLLLSSELKGYIEQPTYYFENVTEKKRADLDLVMLTHGYRRFEWKSVLNNNYPALRYKPENALEINGIAKSMFGASLKSATVSLIVRAGGPLLTANSNDKGEFSFTNLVFTDTTSFVLQAVKAKGGKYTKLVYKSDYVPAVAPPIVTTPVDVSQQMGPYLANQKNLFDDYAKYGPPQGRLLKEVKIRSVKRRDDYRTQSLAGAGFADQVMHSDEIEKIQGMLSTSLNGRLIGVGFDANGIPYNPGRGGRMLVVLDGVEMPRGQFSVNDLSVNQVETIEVLRSNTGSASIYGMAGALGVLVITTKQGGGLDAKDIASVGILPITVMGFYKAREFYSPKYDKSDFSTNRPDLRSTIYWKPDVITDKDGNATITFYNADGTGTYRVIVEGIDEKGNLGRQVYRYRVDQ